MKAIVILVVFSLINIPKPLPVIRISQDLIIANGRMPQLVTDQKNNLDIVYGSGDSIMYLHSGNGGQSFLRPSLVAVLPKLFASAMRGPQIAATSTGLIITANTEYGNIYAYHKQGAATWSGPVKVNDVDSVSKEALMGLSADGSRAFAVWLDVRANGGKGQKLYGAQSADGGITWEKNISVYASPDKSICECCKPSVLVKGDNVFAMFRNWLNGNRDLYLIKSTDAGKTFQEAKKLGNGSWKLNGCPMDGGGFALNTTGMIETVWRREGNIYASTEGRTENLLGTGRGCSIEFVKGKNIYAWIQDGNIIIRKPDGSLHTIGQGSQPLIKALSNGKLFCVWENEKRIHASILDI